MKIYSISLRSYVITWQMCKARIRLDQD